MFEQFFAEMWQQVLLVVTILVPIITAITALIKGYINEKYYALIPLPVGLILGPAAVVFFPEFTIWMLLWAGLLAALAAGGFYSVQNVRNK